MRRSRLSSNLREGEKRRLIGESCDCIPALIRLTSQKGDASFHLLVKAKFLHRLSSLFDQRSERRDLKTKPHADRQHLEPVYNASVWRKCQRLCKTTFVERFIVLKRGLENHRNLGVGSGLVED